MSQHDLPVLNFEGNDDYQPYEGGGHTLLDQEGLYLAEVVSAVPERTKKGDKALVKINMKLLDPDVVGAPVIGRAHYFGLDKNGKSMAKQFADVLVSAAIYTPEQIQQLSKQKQNIDPIAQAAQLVGRRVYLDYKFSTNEGQLTGEVANFVKPERYTEAAAEFKEKGASTVFRGKKQTDASVLRMLQNAAAAPANGPVQPMAGAGAFAPPGMNGLPQFAPPPAPPKL